MSRLIDADALYERAYKLNLDYIVSDVALRTLKRLLSEEPSVIYAKVGRIIDAEELKHILNNSKYYGTKAGNAFADMITECETIKEHRKGKWLWGDGVRCSNCCYKLQTTGLPSCCPNCFAEMEE